MMGEQSNQVKAIFLAAIDEHAPERWPAFLDQACAGDVALRARVEKLLRAQCALGSFHEASRSALSATIDYPIAEGPGTAIDLYKLLEPIGEGGFGVVFLAEQQQPVRRKVALKVLKPGMDTKDVIARFESERQALALMDHPHIARVLDAGATDSGRPYFVMELVQGVPITEFCDQHHLAPEARLKLFLDVCRAIQHAHHKGVIHRDIKPTNVLVTLQDGQPIVKVIDFGVAKAMGQTLTERTLSTPCGHMIGTPAYMSPEQAEMSGLDIDTRSDVYALGVLLYELLTGTTPLEGKRLREVGFAEMQRLIREEEAPRPSTRISALGEAATIVAGNRGLNVKPFAQLLAGDLDWMVMKALEKDRNRRYGTPASFAEDIDRYLRREAILARPPSTVYKVKKFVQRNRTAVLTAAVVAAALLAGAAVATWQAVDARRAEAAAVAAAEAERRAKQDAEARGAEIKAVLQFVENQVLAAARPEGRLGGLGHEVTLRKAVEAALPFVGKSFTNEPLIEARLRLTLGTSFAYLGDSRTAAAQFEAARALFVRHRGPDHPDTLRSMNNLANSYDALGRHADAVALHEATLALRKATLGPDHPDTLTSMNNLANSYNALGRHADALALHEAALSLQKATLGPDHPDTLTSMNNLANSYAALGRHGDAVALREATLTLLKAKLGPDHPDTLTAMNNLASSYYALGRYTDALQLDEATLALAKAKLGPDHPDTLRTMNNLASGYTALGRHANAVPLYKKALGFEKATLGPDHPTTLRTMNNLAVSYDTLGRHTDALKLREETLALRKAKLGPDHPETLTSMNNLAVSYDTLGRHADALALREVTLMLQKAKLGPDHPDTLTSMHNLAHSYVALGRYADALTLCNETLALRKTKLGPDHPDTLLSMGAVAECLVKLDRGTEAMPVIDDCIRRATGRDVHPELLSDVMDLRLRHFAKARDAVGCRQTAVMWENLKRTDAASLYQAARLRAVSAAVLRETDSQSIPQAKEAGAEADRAMAWLTQAVAAGYKNAAHLKQDNDLDVLRDRADFTKLVAVLQPASPEKKPSLGHPRQEANRD
jgi:serine/threonine protein kinase/tetratricopeptide (TPR) repeat protein